MRSSILRKQAPRTEAGESPTQKESHRNLALHHANLIQHRKDTEAAILSSIEALIDFPTSTSQPAQPDISEIALVKSHLKLFQPADFDSVVEERNIIGKCGYILCPRPHRVEKTNAKYRILHKKGAGVRGFDVVERAELEKWCGEDCGKMAIYLRVQMSEVPAWERIGGVGKEIELYGEDKHLGHSSMEVDDLATLANGLRELAIERGDRNPEARDGTIGEQICEADASVLRPPQPPSLEDGRDSVGAIEGYIPKMDGKKALHGTMEYQESDDDWIS